MTAATIDLSVTALRPMQCERCSATFTCGVAGGHPCWCAELQTLSPEAGLCPACLRAVIDAEAA